jgi:glyoxylase-like metal-dependent hydrolase (beta-lactamase superfamily II)/rhodanese-related sulfurtransferase
MARLGLKYFRQDGCLSYIIFHPETRQAALIDPAIELVDSYRDFLSERGLKLLYALDTHTHADHYSATHIFRDQFKAKIGMSAKTESLRPTLKLRHGETLELGDLKITALSTPGHTPDALCYLCEGVLFTGDTLLIGATGRTDFPGADPGELWDSLHKNLAQLPGETLVFPGHDYNDLLFSTLAIERERNSQLALRDRARFVQLKSAETIANPELEVRRRIEFNLALTPPPPQPGLPGAITQCGTPAQPNQGVAAINVDKYWAKLQSQAPDQAYIDVREPGEFRDGHPPGSLNIPLSELGLHLNELMRSKRVYFSCLSGRRSSFAAKTLAYIGHPDAVNVTGGFKAWSQAGLPTEK